MAFQKPVKINTIFNYVDNFMLRVKIDIFSKYYSFWYLLITCRSKMFEKFNKMLREYIYIIKKNSFMTLIKLGQKICRFWIVSVLKVCHHMGPLFKDLGSFNKFHLTLKFQDIVIVDKISKFAIQITIMHGN